MVPSNLEPFFAASAGAAAALTGLLFIAISVSAPRVAAERGGVVHRIRATAALTAFTNSLVISLFALIPVHKVGPTALAAGLSGLAFVLASLLALTRVLLKQRRSAASTRPVLRRLVTALLDTLQGRGSLLDLLFLLGLAVVFVLQAASGVDVILHPRDAGAVENIAVLVVTCFLIGITRSWEVIGGPSLGFLGEVASIVRREPDERDLP